MRYCTRCVYPANHPLGLTFDEEGVCSGCRIHEEKDQLPWAERFEALRAIVESYRDRTGRHFDCIVPVSGARDSHFMVHTVKRELGLNPLLVSYNRQYNTRVGIRNLAYLRTSLDCDHMSQSPSPALLRRILRFTLNEAGSIYWHILAGATVFPVQVAVRLKIPLIIWGAHQGVDQVGMFSHLDEVEMTRKYRKDHDVLGLEAEDLAVASGIPIGDLEPFRYPSNEEIASVGVRGIYLNNYIRWDAKAQHEQMIATYGYESAPQTRTFNTYEDVDCVHYSGLHDWLKLLRYGFGKVSDHASREVRLRRLTREQAIDLVAQYQDVPPADLDRFVGWSGISREDVLAAVERQRNAAVWTRDSGTWRLGDAVTAHRGDAGVEAVRLGVVEPCDYRVTPSREPGVPDDRYITIGRGYVDAAPAQGVVPL
ncbi:MAG: N-acetyl sugar amidotransferase [Acidimicrobiia bacterium]|nr:N-acetyl sugar amidotransferase [Acidimicrobiia bacterium]